MVLPNVLCALNCASSAMLNGVCCYYQMHEEDVRLKQQEAAIQRAIRDESDIHRQKEKEARYRDTVTSHFQAERRRKLMTHKQAGLSHNYQHLDFEQQLPPRQGNFAGRNFDLFSMSTNSSKQPCPANALRYNTHGALELSSILSTNQGSDLASLMDKSLDDDDLEEILLE